MIIKEQILRQAYYLISYVNREARDTLFYPYEWKYCSRYPLSDLYMFIRRNSTYNVVNIVGFEFVNTVKILPFFVIKQVLIGNHYDNYKDFDHIHWQELKELVIIEKLKS